MSKSTEDYFQNAREMYAGDIEEAIAKANGISKKFLKGRVMNQRKLLKVLYQTAPSIWNDASMGPSTIIFKIRYATLLSSYVFENLDRFTKVWFATVLDKTEQKKTKPDDVVKALIHVIEGLCKCATENDLMFHTAVRMIAIMDNVSDSRIGDKRKRGDKIVNGIDTMNLRLQSDDAKDDATFGALLRITYLMCTRAPSSKKAKLFVDGYEFNQKATTYHMIEKLGKLVKKTCDDTSIAEMYWIFMQCKPNVTSQYKGVSSNENLYIGSMSLSYMKFLNNGTPVGDLCYWLK